MECESIKEPASDAMSTHRRLKSRFDPPTTNETKFSYASEHRSRIYEIHDTHLVVTILFNETFPNGTQWNLSKDFRTGQECSPERMTGRETRLVRVPAVEHARLEC